MLQERPRKDPATEAKESALLLAAMRSQQLEISGDHGPLQVPEIAMRLFTEVLAQLAQGKVVRVVGIDPEITTQEAADLLNVSRPFLVELLERGELPFRKVGTHRRVRYQDVLDYKVRNDEERRKILDELTAQAQELGLGYE